MSNESFQLSQQWFLGGAQGGDSKSLKGREPYLFVVDFHNGPQFFVVMAVVTWQGVTFKDIDGYENMDWDWSDVLWFAKCKEFTFPKALDRPNETHAERQRRTENAKRQLQAAAPKLLEAVVAMVDWFNADEDERECPDRYMAVEQLAMEALKEATE